MRLETERLIIREWEARDYAPYASFVADPDVRRYFQSVLSREESDVLVNKYVEYYRRDGFGLLAVERKSDGALVGDVGIIPIVMPIRGTPPVEIGWLLGRQFWGQGYATEAARAWLDHAFNVLKLSEVAAWTAVGNLASQRVMQKIGMTRDPQDDFEHPKIPEGHPLRPHYLYRIANPTGSA